MYLNGVEAGSKTFSDKRQLATTFDLYFGALADEDVDAFRGQISCIQIYQNILSVEEIYETVECPPGMFVLVHITFLK